MERKCTEVYGFGKFEKFWKSEKVKGNSKRSWKFRITCHGNFENKMANPKQKRRGHGELRTNLKCF